jgi:hypothetical protein
MPWRAVRLARSPDFERGRCYELNNEKVRK